MERLIAAEWCHASEKWASPKKWSLKTIYLPYDWRVTTHKCVLHINTHFDLLETGITTMGPRAGRWAKTSWAIPTSLPPTPRSPSKPPSGSGLQPRARSPPAMMWWSATGPQAAPTPPLAEPRDSASLSTSSTVALSAGRERRRQRQRTAWPTTRISARSWVWIPAKTWIAQTCSPSELLDYVNKTSMCTERLIGFVFKVSQKLITSVCWIIWKLAYSFAYNLYTLGVSKQTLYTHLRFH